MRLTKILKPSVVCRLAAFVFLASLAAGPAVAQERTGAIRGVVTDETGAVLPGASVTLTHTATARSVTVATGEDGGYAARSLEPGRYTVKFEHTRFAAAERPDINVLVGQTVQLDIQLKVGRVEEAVQIIEATPLVDVQSSAVSHNVTAEEFDRLPKGRSFQGLLVTSPSVTSGQDQFGNVVGLEGGIQVNGASAAENLFVVDGVPTNSAIHGQSRQNAAFEFLQEVQIKTGGAEAEYGGALGGVLSAVTKSGGNSYHGDVHYFFSTEDFLASPVKRLLNPLTVGVPGFSSIGEGGYVEDEKQPDRRHEVGGSLGGPILPRLRDKAWFFVSASPQWRRREFFYNLTDGADAVKVKRLDQQAFGKISYSPTSRIRTNFSVLWTPTVSTGNPLPYNMGPNARNATVAATQVNKEAGFFQTQSSLNGSIDFIISSRMLASVRGGRFRDNYKGTGIPKITQVEYQASTSNLSPELLATIPANMHGSLGFGNTPRLRFVDHDLTANTFLNADYTVFGNLAGGHELKTGWGVSKTVNNVDDSYPNGGYVWIFWGQSFTSLVNGAPCNLSPCTGTYGYYEVNDIGTKGSTGGTIHSFYVQDKWNVHRRLTLNLGVRFENEKVPSFRRSVLDPAFQFGFGDKIMPRLGAAYDVLGDGKLKISGGWGRYYDWVKYELSRGTFGGDIWTTRYRALDTPDVFSLSAQNMPGRDLSDERVPNSFRDRRIPSFSADCSAENLATCQVDPTLKPTGVESMNVSVEYQLGQTVLRAGYVRSSLIRAIEDLGVLIEGDEHYLYVNPGEGLLGKVMNITPGTATRAPADLCRSLLEGQNLVDCLAGTVFPTPKPVRTYNALELSVTRRFSRGWFVNGSYVYSRLYGNYPGLASTDEIRTPTTGSTFAIGQQQTGQLSRGGSSASRAWDLDQLMFDANGNLDTLGRLATDRPHVLKLYGSYNFRFGTEVGAFFTASSGTPITTYAYTTDQIAMRVNGRGDLGRTPALSQTDMLVSHTFNITEGKKLRFEFNMTNLFNQKTARHIFNCVNYDCINGQIASGMNMSGVDLFQGFDYRALIANSSNGPAAFDPRYQREDLFNPGFAGRFGVKLTF